VKILPGPQGTEQWRANRRGIPTCSQFHRILSPAKLEPSAQAFGYICELVAERLLDVDIAPEATAFMERGTIMEAEAIRWYEFQREIATEKVGLCVRDDGLVGCSPDRLVGEDGGLELKCPSAAVHVGYLLEGLGAKYRLQVQGALWITGRKWWDLLSYNPDLPPALVRVYPEPDVFEALNEHLPGFLERLDAATEKLGGKARGSLEGLLLRSIDLARQARAEAQEAI
jgi:hypothetical protein